MRSFSAYIHAPTGPTPAADAPDEEWENLQGEMLLELPTCGRKLFEEIMMEIYRGHLPGKRLSFAGESIAVMETTVLLEFLERFPPMFGADRVAEFAATHRDGHCVVHLSEF